MAAHPLLQPGAQVERVQGLGVDGGAATLAAVSGNVPILGCDLEGTSVYALSGMAEAIVAHRNSLIRRASCVSHRKTSSIRTMVHAVTTAQPARNNWTGSPVRAVKVS